jgi:hypothetical protein
VFPDIVYLGIPPTHNFDHANGHFIAREKRQDSQDTPSAFTEVAGVARTSPKDRLDGSGASGQPLARRLRMGATK